MPEYDPGEESLAIKWVLNIDARQRRPLLSMMTQGLWDAGVLDDRYALVAAVKEYDKIRASL